MTGEGMLALWGALKSCLKPGDHVVSVGTGVFGDGIGEMAESFGCVSCLEVGPRYLHSTGQLQKGGPNMGVFLILSADELKDIPLPEEAAAPSLGELAKGQAAGRFGDARQARAPLRASAFAGQLRRNAAPVGQVVDDVIADILTDRALAEAAPGRGRGAGRSTVVVEAAEASETAVEAEFVDAPQDAEVEAAEVAVPEGETDEA